MKKIAVFIPSYNASKTIGETLDGINVSAKSAGMIIDVFVCDDRSIDNTFDVIKEYTGTNVSIHFSMNENNVGERATINKHFNVLSDNYKWIFLIHADDIPKAEWIVAISKEIENCDDNTTFTIWSSFDSFTYKDNKHNLGDDSGEVVTNIRSIADAKYYLAKVTSSFHVSGAAFNLKLFHEIGQFDASMPQYGDTEFFARGMIKGFHDIYIRKTLTRYRVINSSVSFFSKKTSRDVEEMFYLIYKYKNILGKTEKRKIILLGGNYSFRRCFKSLLRLQIPLFLFNLRLGIKCSIMLIKNVF